MRVCSLAGGHRECGYPQQGGKNYRLCIQAHRNTLVVLPDFASHCGRGLEDLEMGRRIVGWLCFPRPC